MLGLLSSKAHKLKYFEYHLNPVMLVFITNLSLSTNIWLRMFQRFSHFFCFCIILYLPNWPPPTKGLNGKEMFQFLSAFTYFRLITHARLLRRAASSILICHDFSLVLLHFMSIFWVILKCLGHSWKVF